MLLKYIYTIKRQNSKLKNSIYFLIVLSQFEPFSQKILQEPTGTTYLSCERPCGVDSQLTECSMVVDRQNCV